MGLRVPSPLNNIVSDVNQEHNTDSDVKRYPLVDHKHFKIVFSSFKEQQKSVRTL